MCLRNARDHWKELSRKALPRTWNEGKGRVQNKHTEAQAGLLLLGSLSALPLTQGLHKMPSNSLELCRIPRTRTETQELSVTASIATGDSPTPNSGCAKNSELSFRAV